MIFAHGFHQEGENVGSLSIRLLIKFNIHFVIDYRLFILLKLYFLLSISERLLNKTPTLWIGSQLRVAFCQDLRNVLRYLFLVKFNFFVRFAVQLEEGLFDWRVYMFLLITIDRHALKVNLLKLFLTQDSYSIVWFMSILYAWGYLDQTYDLKQNMCHYFFDK